VETLNYPADLLPLSDYEVRSDALVFRLDSKELRIFEGNGVATLWQLELPRSTNDLDFNSLLDVHLVLHYDAFFDKVLEQSVKATLPSSGAASRAISLRLEAPDELYYLRNQGNAEMAFTPDMFPYTQENQVRTNLTLRAAGDAAAGLTLRIASEQLPAPLAVTLDAEGLASAATQPLKKLLNKSVIDGWDITIDAADNPGLVIDGSLDLAGLDDFGVFLEYSFDYRS
jgi:hypothetical protein